MDDAPVDQADNITAAADTACDAEETAIVIDGSPTEMAELAWSCENNEAPNDLATTVDRPDMSPTESAELVAWSGDEALERLGTGTANEPAMSSLRPLLRWCVAITAVLATAAAVTWLSTDLYHEEESPSSVTPSLTTPTVKPAPPPTGRPMPAPPTTAPAPTSPLAPPPPAHHEVPPPPPPAPAANVNPQTIMLFRSLLARDGMEDASKDVGVGETAQNICGDAAAGNLQPPSSYFFQDPGAPPAPPNGGETALRDNIQAFCPQYAN
ncbi:MAG: hypothetical protein ACRD1G_04780 [Acidimicrobiales bacterium]